MLYGPPEANRILRIKKKKRNNENFITVTLLILLCCVVGNISQLPLLWGNTVVKILFGVIWVALFFILFRISNVKLKLDSVYFLFIIFDILMIVMYAVMGMSGYITSALFYPMNLSFFIYIVGTLMSDAVEEKIFSIYAVFNCVTLAVVGIMVYFEYFFNVDWKNSVEYVYRAKNSMSLILLTGVVFAGVYLYEKAKIGVIVYSAFAIFMVFIMKARAAILSFVICIILYAFKTRSRKKKIAILLIFLAVILIVFLNENLYEIVINNIVLNNRQEYTIDDISSDRVHHLEMFREMMSEHFSYFITGTGGTYLESLPLASIASYGLIGGLLVLAIAIEPLIIAIRSEKNKIARKSTVVLEFLVLILVVNAIFEEQAPFGPGVKCYPIWLMAGYEMGRLKRHKKLSDSEKEPEEEKEAE